MRISDWSSDVGSSYLGHLLVAQALPVAFPARSARAAGARVEPALELHPFALVSRDEMRLSHGAGMTSRSAVESRDSGFGIRESRPAGWTRVHTRPDGAWTSAGETERCADVLPHPDSRIPNPGFITCPPAAHLSSPRTEKPRGGKEGG